MDVENCMVKTIIEGGTLIDGTGRPPEDGVSILVEGGVIKEIGTKVPRPSDAEVIEASGKTSRKRPLSSWTRWCHPSKQSRQHKERPAEAP